MIIDVYTEGEGASTFNSVEVTQGTLNKWQRQIVSIIGLVCSPRQKWKWTLSFWNKVLALCLVPSRTAASILRKTQSTHSQNPKFHAQQCIKLPHHIQTTYPMKSCPTFKYWWWSCIMLQLFHKKCWILPIVPLYLCSIPIGHPNIKGSPCLCAMEVQSELVALGPDSSEMLAQLAVTTRLHWGFSW